MKRIVRGIERTRRYRNDAGFTLIEMLITVIIVGMITASMVMAFTFSIKASTSANDRIKKSNAAQLITRFLVPDAASAGGYDDQDRTISNATLKPGVYIQSATTGGFCDAAGSVVRFEWAARTPTVTTRVASNYSLAGTDLVRTYCTQDLAPPGPLKTTSVVLGKNITSVTPQCISACKATDPQPLSPAPVIVTLNVTSAPTPSASSAYSFSASGFVRAGGSAGTPTTATVPLIALGIPGAPCPATAGGNVPAASGVAVALKQASPADPFEPKITVFGVAAINSNATTAAPCGQAVNISAPTGWFATQTLIVTPGTCNNCGANTIPISAPINDPFADMTPPTYPACSNGSNPASTVVGNERHFFPGVYNQALNLIIANNADQFIFENGSGPAGTGVYVFCKGVTITSGILAQSKPGGVLFYFAGGSLRRVIPPVNGGDDYSDVNWQVDGRPEYRNVVFWQPNPTTASAATTGDLQIAIGENDPTAHPLSSRIGGVIYAPKAQVEFYLPTQETLIQYETVEGTAAAVVARNVVADRIARIRLGDGPQTTTSLTANPNPSTVGQSVTLQATVSPVFPATTAANGTPTGAITFFDDSQQLGSANLVNGVATFVTAALGGGARPIKAIYTGDLVYASSVSPTLNTVLNPAPSTTTLVSSLNPAANGQAVTFTATVAGVGAGPIPTGSVTFYDDVVPLASVALSPAGVATLTQTLPQGLHPIRAVYSGDVSYLISTSNVLQQAVKQASVTILTSAPNPTNPGQQVTLTATVAPVNPGVTATGVVTFFDGAVQIGGGVVALDGTGVATLLVSNLAAGSHSITANYGGDTLLAPSVSNAQVQTVNFAAGAVSLVSNVNPSLLNQSVTFTATVAPQGGLTPTGTITFRDGATAIGGPVALMNGVAARTTSTLALGSRSITAVYSGDANFLAATSPALTEVVQASTTTALTSNRVPSADWGQAVTFTATVTETAPGSPTGTVNFYDNGSFIGQANLVGTTAVLTTSATWFDIGTHPMTATFVPTGVSFVGSTSPVFNQVVNLATTTLMLTSDVNPVAPDQPFTITMTVTAATPTPPFGTVYLYDNNVFFGQGQLNAAGVATFTTSFPGVGTHPISAYYPATNNWQASTYFTLNQVVQFVPTTMVVTSNLNPATPGSTVTLRADISAGGLDPTGQVLFYDNGAFIGSGAVGSGYAVLVVSNFTIGTHPITAVYQATGNFANANFGTLNQLVGNVNTALTVTSNSNPAAPGQQVTLTGTVTAPAGSPTGTVFFYDNGAFIGQGTVVGGAATFVATFTAGTHPISGLFQGTGGFNNSNYFTLNQVVGYSTTLNVTSDTNPSVTGLAVTFTATVTSAGGTPTGSVQLYDNGVATGAVINLVGGTGTRSVIFNPVGNHPITATYTPTGSFLVSTFATLNQRVHGTTTVALIRTAGASPAISGQSQTFTATVNDTIAAVPTGNVTFFDNGAPIGMVTVSAANPPTAAITTSALSIGLHSITAVYNGDANFNVSPTSPAVSQTIVIQPAGFDIQGTPAGTAGRTDNGDKVTFTYNTTIQASSLMSGFTGASIGVTARLTRGAGGSTPTTLAICTTAGCGTLVNLGTVNLNDTGTHYLNTSGQTATATATMTMSTVAGRSVVVITFTSNFGGATVNTVAGNHTLTWTPSATATDTNGFATATTVVTESGAADADF